MLNDIKESKKLTKSVIERFVQYALIAKNKGSQGILLACSSIGEAGDVARKIVNIPIFKIDEPMATEAANRGGNILVIGTVASTLEPTTRLIKSKVLKKEANITEHLIHGVFEIYKTDKVEHDKKIAKVIDEKQRDFNVIVLAQASMSDAIKYVSFGKEKILTSLPLGIYQIEKI